MDKELKEALHGSLNEKGTLPCPRALVLAERLGREPGEVGRAADEEGLVISHCQLGLFGHETDEHPKGKIVKPAPDIPEKLKGLLEAKSADGRIPCAGVFAAAREAGVSRLQASGVVEALGLRVSVCQLGCFPRPKAWS